MQTTEINFTPKGTRGEFQRNWRNKTNLTSLLMLHFICIWNYQIKIALQAFWLQSAMIENWLNDLTRLNWIYLLKCRSVGKTIWYCYEKFRFTFHSFLMWQENQFSITFHTRGKTLIETLIKNKLQRLTYGFNVHDTEWNKTNWHTVCASSNGHGTSCFLNLLDQSM